MSTTCPPGAAADATDRLSPETVLLVEDDAAVRNLSRTILVLNGYVVLDVPDGADALAVCERHAGTVHVLVTDVLLPGMSGPELAVRLQALRPDLRVLFTSGCDDDVLTTRGVPDNAAVLRKPFSGSGLVRAVRETLAAAPGEGAPRRVYCGLD